VSRSAAVAMVTHPPATGASNTPTITQLVANTERKTASAVR